MELKYENYTAHRVARELMWEKGPTTPPEVLAALVQSEAIDKLYSAVIRIAQGDQFGPAGLEGLAIAIAGDNLRSSVAASMSGVGAALDRLADIAEAFADKQDA